MSSEPENIQNANNDVAKEKINENKTDNSQEEKSRIESVQKPNTMDNNKDSPVENDNAVSNSKENDDENEKSNSIKSEENDTKEKLEQVKGEESENENDKTVSSNDSTDVKKEDQENDDLDDKPDTEDTEATEEENDKKKDVPLLDQPLEKSGTRERKKVQRFNEEFNASEREASKLEIPEGSGQQLGEIPRIDASISRFKTDDLKNLHKILFKTPGKTTLIKKNIKKFNGFDFDKDSEQYQKKLNSVQKMELKHLKSICEMLDLEKKGNRDEIGLRICEFLMEPKDSGKPVTVGGRPKRSAAIKANNRGYSSHEDFTDDDGPPSKRPQRAIRGKGKRPNLKDESSSNESVGGGKASESENEGVSSAEEIPKVVSRSGRGRGKAVVKKNKKDSDSEEFDESDGETTEDDSDEPKSKRRRSTSTKSTNNKSKRSPVKKSSKSTPKKAPAQAKSKKATQENKRGKGRRTATKRDESSNEDSEAEEKASSSEDEPLMKKSKSPQPPTDEEIKSYVKEILEGANLEEITMKTVCKQVYAHYPDFDLAHKKDFIKTTVKSLIST